MKHPANVNMLEVELTTLKAQNLRLKEQNISLQQQLEQDISDGHSNSVLNVEYKIKAFRMEEQRDCIYEAYQKLKKKYNKLQDAYACKLARTKALEETFQRQKTLTGLVLKSTLAQKQKEQQLLSAPQVDNEVAELQQQVSKLQVALNESYDIIDEMDFELESVDLLEMQNQNLRKELATLKSQQSPAAAAAFSQENAPSSYVECDSECDSCNKNDDADAETIERAAMTHSLIQTVEAESNCLRRELLRSRWQRTVHDKLKCDEGHKRIRESTKEQHES